MHESAGFQQGQLQRLRSLRQRLLQMLQLQQLHQGLRASFPFHHHHHRVERQWQ